MRLGELEVTAVVSSRFRLDGGSMFGIVPKVLWERKAPADDRNRIELAVNSLVVRTGGHVALIELGMGSKYDEKQRLIYDLADAEAATAIRKAGLDPADVEVVIPTHLHLDHAGGSTVLGPSGDVLSAFPRARFVVQELECEAALNPLPVEKGSYASDDFKPLLDGGRLEVVSGSAEVLPGITVELTGGHTRGHQVVRLRGGGGEALYLGDIVPTCAHLKLNWLMAWDLDPAATYEQKERLLAEAASRGATCFFPHDPVIAGAVVEAIGDDAYGIVAGTEVRAL